MVGEPVIPNRAPVAGYVELYDDNDPIVHVPDPYDRNKFVEVRRSSLQPTMPTPPRDLTPLPLIDPLAQRLVGGGVLGVGAGAAGWGAGQLLMGASQLISAVAGVGSAAFAIALLILAAKMTGGGQSRTTVNITNNNRWWGRSTTRL
ncbi:hypothetical protein ABZ468_08135 [Streptomyces sp. NPDC005708]|uniref:hypothetical protein n=1 Tax=Streptomyces sp. NPDC005708 TaxID=3154564 RepID=UPI0033D269BC